MGGSAPSPALVALLCLGLCRGPRDQVQAGTLPKPAIWADPGPVVAVGSPVTLWCQGSPQAELYRLYRDSGSGALAADKPHGPSDNGRFHFKSMTQRRAGRYQCDYHKSSGRSERSEPLALVVTGVDPAPSLSAQPSPVVASGGNVTLTCSSRDTDTAGTFYLLKEGGADPPRQRNSSFLEGRHQALFPVGPAGPSHGGSYRCYQKSNSYPNQWSHPSAPLRLQVTGVYGEPSLRAQPGAPVLPGRSLTLRCGAQAGFDRFALARGEGPPRRLDGQRSPDFPLGPVNHTHGGRYRCYGGHSLSHTWSAPSAPLDVLIAGLHARPSLSAQPGPAASLGENVTLRCRSAVRADTFHLSKEGAPGPPQRLRVQDTAAPPQAHFTLTAVGPAHGGTYRCYSSHSSAPFALSHSSEPLELRVSDAPGSWYISVLSGAAAASLLLLSLLLLLLRLLRQRWRRGERRKRDAAQTDTQPEEGARLDPQQGINSEASREVVYALVNHRRCQQGLRDVKDRRAKEAAAPEEVTYAQLNHLALAQETAPSSSPSEGPPAEPSLYAALAAR